MKSPVFWHIWNGKFSDIPRKIGDMIASGEKVAPPKSILPGGQLALATHDADRDWGGAIVAITAKSVTGAHSAWLYELYGKSHSLSKLGPR